MEIDRLVLKLEISQKVSHNRIVQLETDLSNKLTEIGVLQKSVEIEKAKLYESNEILRDIQREKFRLTSQISSFEKHRNTLVESETILRSSLINDCGTLDDLQLIVSNIKQNYSNLAVEVAEGFESRADFLSTSMMSQKENFDVMQCNLEEDIQTLKKSHRAYVRNLISMHKSELETLNDRLLKLSEDNINLHKDVLRIKSMKAELQHSKQKIVLLEDIIEEIKSSRLEKQSIIDVEREAISGFVKTLEEKERIRLLTEKECDQALEYCEIIKTVIHKLLKNYFCKKKEKEDLTQEFESLKNEDKDWLFDLSIGFKLGLDKMIN